jgi:gamma-glutamylcyclotransferase (GGCT)/AIG2-like uncharacterized protein YtfP
VAPLESTLTTRLTSSCHRPPTANYLDIKISVERVDLAAWGAVNPDSRLATYGTLAPGRPNHHQLDGLDGRWFEGQVFGTLVEEGWGADLGYPALLLDSEATAIDVQVFESVDLPAHWARLDDFEGPGYQRVVTNVRTPSGDVAAFIYVAVTSLTE